MKSTDITVRTAAPDDARELLEIYAPYVTDTAVTFECTPPSVCDFEKRIKKTLLHYPYLTAVLDGEPVGYAYASALSSREAYSHSAELSVYVRTDKRGLGIGGILYTALEEILKKQNVTNLYACVSFTDKTDRRLDNRSVEFHKKQGYATVGHFNGCGRKFGKTYDVLWMEKVISDRISEPFIPFSELK